MCLRIVSHYTRHVKHVFTYSLNIGLQCVFDYFHNEIKSNLVIELDVNSNDL